MFPIGIGCHPQKPINRDGCVGKSNDSRPFFYDKETEIIKAFSFIANCTYSNRDLFDQILGSKCIDSTLHSVCYDLACNNYTSKKTASVASWVPVLGSSLESWIAPEITDSSVKQILFLFMASHEIISIFSQDGRLNVESLNGWIRNVVFSRGGDFERNQRFCLQLINAVQDCAEKCHIDHHTGEGNTSVGVRIDGLKNFVYFSLDCPKYPARVILNLLELSQSFSEQALIESFVEKYNDKLEASEKAQIQIVFGLKTQELAVKARESALHAECTQQDITNRMSGIQRMTKLLQNSAAPF